MDIPLLTISFLDYVASVGKQATDFTCASVSGGCSQIVGSGDNLDSIWEIERGAKINLLDNTPKGTVAVVSLQKTVQRSIPDFLHRGSQYVSFDGTAVIPK